MTELIIVGVAQARPVAFDLARSVSKATELMGQAARRGAKLLVFGETWLSGYPAWLDYCPGAALWNHEPTKLVFARLREHSVVVPGPVTTMLGEAAGDLGLTLVIGLNERVDEGAGNGTLYNTLLTFGPNGKRLNHHRKLVPTFNERMIWGQGDGAGLEAVETPVGRVGGLICWEHWLPLARQTLHVSGERLHVAVWPSVNEMHQLASRHYAFEGRCFVLAAGLIMPVADLPAELPVTPELKDQPERLILNGGSAIIGPDGQYIVAPVYDEETILIAELDPAAIDRECLTLDVSGHSHRPDVYDLKLRYGLRT